jgi:hypothetical protein
MITFAQTQNQPPFDWHAFLDSAIAGKPVYIENARYLASKWVTCACGNQCAVIPRGWKGEPLDPELKEMGLHFFKDIECNQWERAKRTLSAIEARSTAILEGLAKTGQI